MEWNQEDMIKACKEQDKQAQMAMFRRYHKKLLGVCLRYLYNKEIAEEVLMDSFIVIFKKIDKYTDGSFEAWLKTIVIHKSIDYYRSHKNDPVFAEIEKNEWRTIKKTPQHGLEAQDLMRMLDYLPHGYRLVFNLYAIEGFKHKEIADKLGISVNTSKTQYHKARLRLQEILKKGGYHG